MSNPTCNVCDKKIHKNQLRIECEHKACKQSVHIKCNLMNKKEYEYQKTVKDPFFCIRCLEDNVPFTKISDNEFSFSVIRGVNTQLCDDNIKIQFFQSIKKDILKTLIIFLKELHVNWKMMMMTQRL